MKNQTKHPHPHTLDLQTHWPQKYWENGTFIYLSKTSQLTLENFDLIPTVESQPLTQITGMLQAL